MPGALRQRGVRGGGTCDTAGVGSTEATNSGSSCSRVRRRWRLRSACSAGRVSKRCLDTEAVFVCIGGEPRTEWANRDHYQLDPSGYLLTGSDLEVDEIGRPFGWTADRMPYPLETNVSRVFATGDVRAKSTKRVSTAVGDGAMAIRFIQEMFAHEQIPT